MPCHMGKGAVPKGPLPFLFLPVVAELEAVEHRGVIEGPERPDGERSQVEAETDGPEAKRLEVEIKSQGAIDLGARGRVIVRPGKRVSVVKNLSEEAQFKTTEVEPALTCLEGPVARAYHEDDVAFGRASFSDAVLMVMVGVGDAQT